MLADKQFPKIVVAQDIAECEQRLLQDLLPVRDKQQTGLLVTLEIELLEVECRNHGLASTGGGYDEIAPAIVRGPLTFQSFEDAFLKWMGRQVKENCCRLKLGATSPFDGAPQTIRRTRIKGNELTTIPIGLELSRKLLKNMFHILSSYLQIPLQSTCYCRM